MTNTEETAWLESVRVEFEELKPFASPQPLMSHHQINWLDRNKKNGYQYAHIQVAYIGFLAAKRKDRETIELLKDHQRNNCHWKSVALRQQEELDSFDAIKFIMEDQELTPSKLKLKIDSMEYALEELKKSEKI